MSSINILGLDIGEKRVGIARVNTLARIPEPLLIAPVDDTLESILQKTIKDHDITRIVIGLPRNLDGQETAQTQFVKYIASEYIAPLGLEIVFQDETLSTVKASEYMREHKLKGHDDAIAACVILDDYCNNGLVTQVQ